MKKKHFFSIFLLLFVTKIALGQWEHKLQWQIGNINTGYDNLSSGYGPRNAGGASTGWFHTGVDVALTSPLSIAYPPYSTNPTTTKVCQLYSKSIGTGNSEWVHFLALEPVSGNANLPTKGHDVKELLYYHVSGHDAAPVGTTYLGGAPIAPIHVKTVAEGQTFAHSHLTTFMDRLGFPQNYEYYSSYNPFGFLPKGSCTANDYTAAFGRDAAGGTFFQLEIKEMNGCRVFDRLDVAFSAGATPVGDYVIGLDERLSKILQDLSNPDGTDAGPTSPASQLGIKYNGVVIQADPHSSNSTPYVVRYRIYYTGSGNYSLVVKDFYGLTIADQATSPIPTCTGCTPPTNAPAPPSSLTASTVSNGINLSWSNVTAGKPDKGYRLYRREASSPSILYSNIIGYVMNAGGPPNSFLDLLTNSQVGTRPGADYKYSVATVEWNLEGCNGPLAGSPQPANCIPPIGQTCASYCPVTEKTARMTSVALPLSGLRFIYQGANKMVFDPNGKVGITGSEAGTVYSGLIFKSAGVSSASISTVGSLTIPGAYSNNVPPLTGLKFHSPNKDFYITGYGKLTTNGPGDIQQYSF